MRPLTFLHGNHYPRCNAVVDKRFENYCSLQVITSGAIDLRYDQVRHRLSGGWVFLSYPGPWIHFTRAAGTASWDHRYVAFQGPLMAHWFESDLLPFPPQRIPTEGDFLGRFNQLLHLFPREDSLGQLRAVNLLEGLLMELADLRREKEVRWLDQARDLLRHVPGFRPDYQAIAQQLGMGLSTFRRTFRKQAGLSVHQFVLQTRIEAARHLLVETQLPIKNIARQLGYRDVFFFSRQFAGTVGRAPGAYRKSST